MVSALAKLVTDSERPEAICASPERGLPKPMERKVRNSDLVGAKEVSLTDCGLVYTMNLR